MTEQKYSLTQYHGTAATLLPGSLQVSSELGINP
jgi:hypothetical protein